MSEEEEEIEIVITKDKLCVRNFGSFDPVDDVMFVPMYAPGRQKNEPDSMQLEETDFKTFANYDLKHWKNKETRRFICAKIVEDLIGSAVGFDDNE